MNKNTLYTDNFYNKSHKSTLWGIITLILITLSACAPPDTTTIGFDSDIPDSRLYAIRQAIINNDVEATQQIIECLDSDDPALRFVAIHALEKMYNTNMGYHYYDTDPEREKAINQWVQAYRENKLTLVIKNSRTPESPQK